MYQFHLLCLRAQSETAKDFREDYETLVGGLRGLPLMLPGTDYWRAQAAKRRLLRKIEGYIRRRGSWARSQACRLPWPVHSMG